MSDRVLIRLEGDAGSIRGIIRDHAGEILADYGTALLARLDRAGRDALAAHGASLRTLAPTAAFPVRGFAVNAQPDAPHSSSATALKTTERQGRTNHILCVSGPMHPDWRQTLERMSVVFFESVATDSYLIEIDSANVDDVQSLPFVEALFPYYPALKVNPALLTPALTTSLAVANAVTPLPTTGDAAAPDAGTPAAPDAGTPAAATAPPWPDFTRSTGREQTPSGAGNLELRLFNADDQLAAVDALRAAGIHVVSARGTSIVVAADRQQVHQLAALPYVREINPYRPPHLHANVAAGIIRANAAWETFGLDGAGQVLGIADSGLDTGVNDASLSADFAGRVVDLIPLGRPGDASDPDGHGTHVAGAAVGDGTHADGAVRGIAPGARLVLQSLLDAAGGLGGLPADLGHGLFAVARQRGVHIHSNSWGANVNGTYNSNAAEADAFAFHHRDFLILFSAGNFAPRRITSPGSAKNVLTVGASESRRPLPAQVTFPASPRFPSGLTAGFDGQADDPDQVAAFSCPGPVQGNRRKPDVVAPGSWILASRSSVAVYDAGPDGIGPSEAGPTVGFPQGGTGDEDGHATHPEAVGLGLPGRPIFASGDVDTPALPGTTPDTAVDRYMYLSGTSMATPIVAGACALLRQYLVEQRQHTPSAALLKALIINGAVDMGAGVPDARQGWGRVDVANAIRPPGMPQIAYDDTLDNAVGTLTIRRYDVHVPDPAAPLAITLVWRDPPGAAIQNALHLRLRHVPTGTVHVADDINDIRNNVQKIHLPAPATGAYALEVEGVNIFTGVPELPTSRQDFALAVAGANGFSCKPFDLVFLLDASADMAALGYLKPAHQFAGRLVDLLQINDRFALVTLDERGARIPLTPVNAAADRQALQAQLAAVAGGGTADLRAGLEAGLALLGSPTGRRRLMVIATAADGILDEALLQRLAVADVQVVPVALGPSADVATLSTVARRTGGTAAHVIHTRAELPHLSAIAYALIDGYGCGHLIHLQADTVSAPAPLAHAVDLDATVTQAHFALAWDGPHAPHLSLRDPDGHALQPDDDAVRVQRRPGHALMRVTLPRPGRWRLVAAVDGDHTIPVTAAVLAQSAVRCAVQVDPDYLFHGQVLLRLAAALGDKPLVDGKVKAVITFPTRPATAGAPTPLKTIELPLRDDGMALDPQAGDGIYTALFEPSAAGVDGPFDVTIHLTAPLPERADDGRHQCVKRVPVHVPRFGRPSVIVRPPFARRNRLWGYTLLGARARHRDGTPITPADGLRVTMRVVQGGAVATSGDLPFYRRGGYYIWRLRQPGFAAGSAEVTVTVWRGEEPVAAVSGPVELAVAA